MRVLNDRVHTIWLSRDELAGVTSGDLADAERDKALADLSRAESRGFLGCDAVFVDGKYDGLHERAVRDNGRADWGRGQDVTRRNFWRDGALVRDPEWQPEPPEKEWETDGLRCHVILHPSLGHRCGYVGVPVEHPWFGKGYDDCLLGEICPVAAQQEADSDGYYSHYEHTPGSRVEVHGGLTYAGKEADGWWYFGFDCAHSGDAPSPEAQAENLRRMGFSMARDGDHHWTLEEVERETNDLAVQLSKVAS